MGLSQIQLCEDRKNRIRYNKVTDEDIENGFTPENFPYLTTLSKKILSREILERITENDKK